MKKGTVLPDTPPSPYMKLEQSLRTETRPLSSILHPNGEIVIYSPRKLSGSEFKGGRISQAEYDAICLSVAVWGGVGARILWLKAAGLWPVGLSRLYNFDKPPKTPVRYGSKGLTPKGGRRVRNAAFLMFERVGKKRLTFATTTLPHLSPEDYALIHESWHRVVDNYRREMGRLLRSCGLPGDIVGVSEIQPQRFNETGVPWLHAHWLFEGTTLSGRRAVLPKVHDSIWKKSLELVLGRTLPKLKSACKLETPRSDVSEYLGKYASKGCAELRAVLANGWEWILPKQWYSCSRSLVLEVKKRTRYCLPFEFLSTLLDNLESGVSLLWEWSGTFSIDGDGGRKIPMAIYGKLRVEAMELINKTFEIRLISPAC
jgi:hypothetical protein